MNISVEYPPVEENEQAVTSGWYQSGSEVYYVRPGVTVCFDQQLNKIHILVGRGPLIRDVTAIPPGTRIEVLVT